MRRGNILNSALVGAWARSLPVLLALAIAGAHFKAAAGDTRTLTFYNTHTKETATITYKVDGEFVPEGMDQINHMMRDWRRDEPTEMDRELIDLIWELYQELGSQKPIHLISGYRSRKTNEKLRRRGGGQARNSQHIHGKAADIHFPDISVRQLRNSALVREIGGVGYYPRSALPFVHVDTGKVRHWPRLPRLELAALFPNGKTQHMPRDRKPITIADARRAMKKYPQLAARMKRPARPQPVTVASSRDVIADHLRRLKSLAEKSTETQPLKPPVVMASFGSSSLPFTGSDEVTGSVTNPQTRATSAPLQLASADPTAGIPARRPAVTNASVLNLADEDPEHPEELRYEPFSVWSLMGDTPLSNDATLMALEAPGHRKYNYLLTSPEHALELPLKKGTGTLQLAAHWQFTGQAVRNLRASQPVVAERDGNPRRDIRTASSPVSAAPVTASAFSTGGFAGSGSVFGFSY